MNTDDAKDREADHLDEGRRKSLAWRWLSWLTFTGSLAVGLGWLGIVRLSRVPPEYEATATIEMTGQDLVNDLGLPPWSWLRDPVWLEEQARLMGVRADLPARLVIVPPGPNDDSWRFAVGLRLPDPVEAAKRTNDLLRRWLAEGVRRLKGQEKEVEEARERWAVLVERIPGRDFSLFVDLADPAVAQKRRERAPSAIAELKMAAELLEGLEKDDLIRHVAMMEMGGQECWELQVLWPDYQKQEQEWQDLLDRGLRVEDLRVQRINVQLDATRERMHEVAVAFRATLHTKLEMAKHAMAINREKEPPTLEERRMVAEILEARAELERQESALAAMRACLGWRFPGPLAPSEDREVIFARVVAWATPPARVVRRSSFPSGVSDGSSSHPSWQPGFLP